MKRVALPSPPAPPIEGPQLAHFRAMYDWASVLKQALETTINANMAPCTTPMLSTAFTTNTVLNGTATTTDLANVLGTLIAVLQAKGILSPTAPFQ